MDNRINLVGTEGIIMEGQYEVDDREGKCKRLSEDTLVASGR